MKVKSQKITTYSTQQTQLFAQDMAAQILKEKKYQKKAIILGLKGDLGSGKTTFIQGLAKGLGIEEKILSPTFVLLKCFKNNKINLYHLDCYRLSSDDDLADLNFQDIVGQKNSIIAIEWAEKIAAILPQDTLWLYFNYTDNNKRTVTIYAKASHN